MNETLHTVQETVLRLYDAIIINRIVQEATKLPDNPKTKRGGIIAICDKSTGIMVCISSGQIPDDKRPAYLRNASEKVTRLIGSGEASSFSSRNAKKEHWGGGVTYGTHVVAFSGFTEKVDEAVALAYAVCRDQIVFGRTGKPFDEAFCNASIQSIRRVLKKHYAGNEFIIPLAKKVFSPG